MPAPRLLPAAALLGASILLLSACTGPAGSTDDDGGAPAEQGGTLSVITPTDVYSDLAQQILDDTAEVTPLVDNPAADPHSYEATPQDRLTVDGADVILANGGGYDPFLNRLAATSGKEDAVYQLIEGENTHIDAEEEHEDGHEGHDHSQDFVNEHIWYDLAALSEEIDALDERNRAIEAEGMRFLATEAVSQFLLIDAGFEDATDQQFLAAVEHGADVAVLDFNETIPDEHDSYLEWMEANVEAVETVVEESRG